jgi:hypothetical protein
MVVHYRHSAIKAITTSPSHTRSRGRRAGGSTCIYLARQLSSPRRQLRHRLSDPLALHRQRPRKAGLPGRITLDAKWYIGQELVAYGRKPADNDQAAFQGIHARYVLVIIDEAGGVPKSIFDAVDALATNIEARGRRREEPDDPASHFATICKPGSGWAVKKISVFDTPAYTGEEVPAEHLPLLVSPEWVEERKVRWGVNGPIYQSKVLGEFPDLSRRHVDLAEADRGSPEAIPSSTTAVPASPGTSPVSVRTRPWACAERVSGSVCTGRTKADTMTTTGHIAKAMRDIDAEADKNDCTGAGRSCGTAYSVDGRFCSSSRCVGGKSGTGWGCTQLFKLLGQKEYLGAGHAVFVASACDPTRVDRADARFRHLDLHALHVPGPVMTAGHWALWQRLADRGLIATAVPPTAAAVAAATRAANRRRLAEDTLRRAVRDPGYSTVFANAAHLIKAIDDVGMTLADPGARLLAVWAMRDRWWQSGQDAAEEEALAARRGLAMAIASSPKLGLQ